MDKFSKLFKICLIPIFIFIVSFNIIFADEISFDPIESGLLDRSCSYSGRTTHILYDESEVSSVSFNSFCQPRVNYVSGTSTTWGYGDQYDSDLNYVDTFAFKNNSSVSTSFSGTNTYFVIHLVDTFDNRYTLPSHLLINSGNSYLYNSPIFPLSIADTDFSISGYFVFRSDSSGLSYSKLDIKLNSAGSPSYASLISSPFEENSFHSFKVEGHLNISGSSFSYFISSYIDGEKISSNTFNNAPAWTDIRLDIGRSLPFYIDEISSTTLSLKFSSKLGYSNGSLLAFYPDGSSSYSSSYISLGSRLYDSRLAEALNFSGGDDVDDPYSFVNRIYPTKITRDVSDWVSTLRGTYERVGKKYMGLYLTRYYIDKDCLSSYYLLYDLADNPNISTALTDDGISITFSDSLLSYWGLTAIYDNDWLSRFTPANHGEDVEEYNNYKNWNTFNTVYLEPWDNLVITHLMSSNRLTLHRYTYSELGFNKTLNLTEIDSGTVNPYFEADGKSDTIKFYASQVIYDTNNDSEPDYVDYYVLMGLNEGFSSPVASIYNASNYVDDDTKEYIFDHYTGYEFLNIQFVYVHPLGESGDEYFNNTFDITSPSDPVKEDSWSFEYIEETKATYGTESEFASMSIISTFEDIFDTLGKALNSDFEDITFYMGLVKDYSSYYGSCIDSLSDTRLLSAGSFVSEQLDWIYYNTDFKIPIDIGLVSAVVMGVIF